MYTLNLSLFIIYYDFVRHGVCYILKVLFREKTGCVPGVGESIKRNFDEAIIVERGEGGVEDLKVIQ